MTADLEHRIVGLLGDRPNLLAREIADALGVDKGEINQTLYGRLKGRVLQDRRYRWALSGGDAGAKWGWKPEEQFADTDLAKLCRYYLACIGYDNTGISVFASSKFGDPDYTELETLPLSASALANSEAGRQMFGRVRSERGRHGVFLGYPTATRLIRSRKSNWQGYLVEPLLLVPVEIDSTTGSLVIDLEYPIINQRALQSFTNAEPEALVAEIALLEEELGVGRDSESVELDELVMRLTAIRPEWPWLDDIDPGKLRTEPSLATFDIAGIHNRAVLVMAERSPFTIGLEAELKALAKLPEANYRDTVLGQWLGGKCADIAGFFRSNEPLIELLPMNLEQRQAVEASLTQSLTIITGPPGTGKSQVVSNLLANAAWQNKRILFASKNNKAVDVVESRINSLGARPILLRVGAKSYQAKLAEYLLGLLSATASQEDRDNFAEANDHYRKLIRKLERLDEEADRTIQARNTTDELEQAVEFIREKLGQEMFAHLRHSPLPDTVSDVSVAAKAIESADRANHGWFTRLFWTLTVKNRIEHVRYSISAIGDLSEAAMLPLPDQPFGEETIEAYREHLVRLPRRLIAISKLRRYSEALRVLQSSSPLELIAVEKAKLLDLLSRQAGWLWKLWLRLQPSHLTGEERNRLTRYNSLLKMVMEAGAEGELSREVAKRYRALSAEAAHLLPCWAVTSLSARGRIPFEPGYFDLVVFDEASQCDIASALPLLYRAKAAVIIGDPKQLSHISALPKGQDQSLLERYGLVEKFPHWAYSFNSLFALAAGQVAGDQIVGLLDHHRSHADIIGFSNDQFYEERLRVATNYDRLNFPAKGEPGVRWVDVPGRVIRPLNGSAVNRIEAEAVVKELSALVLARNYRGSVGVVTPFQSQRGAIEAAIRVDEALSRALPADFLVDTVHKFQGDERDVMIFSPVLSEDMPKGGMSFLRSNGNLFNVAITRARAQLIVVGDLAACRQCEVGYLSAFADYAGRITRQDRSPQIEQFERFGPEYPQVSNSEQVSEWERIFYRALRGAGISSIPQYPIEKYRLDFLVLDGKRRLNIEIDGERYHRNWTGELCRRDQLRNHRLFELGYDVMRFWVYEVRDDIEGCVEKVQRWLVGKANR